MSTSRPRPQRSSSRAVEVVVMATARATDPQTTILDALDDDTLFGSAFPERDSWRAWRVVLAGLFGLPLEAEDRELYERHTGRREVPSVLPKEGWVVVGRRGGKSRIAAAVAVYLAAFRDYTNVLAGGERGTLPIIAADRKQAGVVFKYVRGLLEGSPVLRRLIESETADSIDLTNGVTIEVHTASWRSTRGYTLIGAILDEIAFWRTADDSANPDSEILAAPRPGRATVPDALLLAISSPYARRGCLWEAYQQHYGQDGDPIFVWQAPTEAMNPKVDPQIIVDAYAKDEAEASAEFGAEFRRDLEAFGSRETLQACIVNDRH